MTRRKYTIEIAVQDAAEEQGFRNFEAGLSSLTSKNVPASSGWTILKCEDEKVYDTFDLNAPKDPCWEAILDKIKTLEAGGYRLASRSASYQMPRSGAKQRGLFCVYKGRRINRPDDGTVDVFHIEAYIDRDKNVKVDVDGPFTDSYDEYWLTLADSARMSHIVTTDWVHRTISKDNPEAVAAGGGGHGGTEFRFVIDEETAERFRKQEFRVEELDAVEPDDGRRWIVVTRNCWFQGVIPPKHRHLFKVNAEMIKGFTPARNDI